MENPKFANNISSKKIEEQNFQIEYNSGIQIIGNFYKESYINSFSEEENIRRAEIIKSELLSLGKGGIEILKTFGDIINLSPKNWEYRIEQKYPLPDVQIVRGISQQQGSGQGLRGALDSDAEGTINFRTFFTQEDADKLAEKFCGDEKNSFFKKTINNFINESPDIVIALAKSGITPAIFLKEFLLDFKENLEKNNNTKVSEKIGKPKFLILEASDRSSTLSKIGSADLFFELIDSEMKVDSKCVMEIYKHSINNEFIEKLKEKERGAKVSVEELFSNATLDFKSYCLEIERLSNKLLALGYNGRQKIAFIDEISSSGATEKQANLILKLALQNISFKNKLNLKKEINTEKKCFVISPMITGFNVPFLKVIDKVEHNNEMLKRYKVLRGSYTKSPDFFWSDQIVIDRIKKIAKAYAKNYFINDYLLEK